MRRTVPQMARLLQSGERMTVMTARNGVWNRQIWRRFQTNRRMEASLQSVQGTVDSIWTCREDIPLQERYSSSIIITVRMDRASGCRKQIAMVIIISDQYAPRPWLLQELQTTRRLTARQSSCGPSQVGIQLRNSSLKRWGQIMPSGMKLPMKDWELWEIPGEAEQGL